MKRMKTGTLADMQVTKAVSQDDWDAFLCAREWSPFLQSWTMGDVMETVGQEPVRLELRGEHGAVEGVCFAHVVPARRGKHLSVPYGPVIAATEERMREAHLASFLTALREEARKRECRFLRLSPFWKREEQSILQSAGGMRSPLHLLAEDVWILHLKGKTEEELMTGMRKTTRNLIRRAEKEGVTVRASHDPTKDVALFLELHDETRKRHRFTPYSNAFITAQLEAFAKKEQATLYLAEYRGRIISSSIHMHMGGETSYHHGASTQKYGNIPASVLLQWTAIRDARKRGDAAYNFWGIAPDDAPKNHPFAGVTLFKTGFGGERMELVHCVDVPLDPRYHVTRAIETIRKWRRGFASFPFPFRSHGR